MKKFALALLLLLTLPAHAAESTDVPTGIPTVAVLADASLALPMARIARDYSREHGTAVALAFATPQDETGQTADSIAADVLITAKAPWLAGLKQQGLVDVHSEAEIGADRLVLVGPADVLLAAHGGFPTAPLILAMGGEPLFGLPNPETLPEGAPARDALRALGAAADLEPYTVYLNDRAQLEDLVARHGYGVTLGMVARQHNMHVLDELPPKLYTPISYRAAVLAGDNMAQARQFVDYLRTEAAQKVFKEYGLN